MKSLIDTNPFNLKINRYILKPGVTLSEIMDEVRKKKIVWKDGGKWISSDSENFLSVTLFKDVSLVIAFPSDFSKWYDLVHVLVWDEMCGQTYIPFYSYLENQKKEVTIYLRTVIDKYNETMDSLSFLEKLKFVIDISKQEYDNLMEVLNDSLEDAFLDDDDYLYGYNSGLLRAIEVIKKYIHPH